MPDLLRKWRAVVSICLSLAGATIFVSCAHEKPALVDDPDAKREGAMPWNKQETWETQGAGASGMAGISDRR